MSDYYTLSGTANFTCNGHPSIDSSFASSANMSPVLPASEGQTSPDIHLFQSSLASSSSSFNKTPVHSRIFTPTRVSSPPKIAKPGPKSRSVSRIVGSMDTVRRKLEFPPEDEFSILKLLPVVRKEPLVKMHRSEAEFLSNQTAKKLKLSPTKDVKDNKSIPTMQLAKGLSKSQLLDMLETLTADNPELTAKLSQLLPKPDLSGLILSLGCLNQNIYKALPVTRLSNRTDSMAYKQVAVHLVAFKRNILDHLHMLMEARQWDSVLEYVVAAWDIVRATPLWDNSVHNDVRISCFKHLASAVSKVVSDSNVVVGEDKIRKIWELVSIGDVQVREVELCKEKLQNWYKSSEKSM